MAWSEYTIGDVAPPLTVSDAELDLGLEILDRAITDVTG
jgi:2,2-dialkylglycine decarboxylase (pyruvate)